MATPERISTLNVVPEKQGTVKPMLTPQEKTFLDMLASSIVKSIQEKSKTAATGSGTK
jgi:hypothetical protein